MISKITIRISLGNVLNLLASVINKLFMFLLRSFMAQISVQLYRPFRLALAWKGYEKIHS